jgi:hypothetical protein
MMGIAEAMDDVVGSGLGLLESTFRHDGGVDTSSIFKLMKIKAPSDSLVDDTFTSPTPKKRLVESDSITVSKSDLKAFIREAVLEAMSEATDDPLKAGMKTAGLSKRDVKDLPPEKKVDLLNAGTEELDKDKEESYSGNSFARRFAELLDDSQRSISEPDEMDIEPELSGKYFDAEDKEEELHADLDLDGEEYETDAHAKKVFSTRNPADSGINGEYPKDKNGNMFTESLKRIWKNSVNEINEATDSELLEVVTKQELNSVAMGLIQQHRGFKGLNENKIRHIFNSELERFSTELGLL